MDQPNLVVPGIRSLCVVGFDRLGTLCRGHHEERQETVAVRLVHPGAPIVSWQQLAYGIRIFLASLQELGHPIATHLETHDVGGIPVFVTPMFARLRLGERDEKWTLSEWVEVLGPIASVLDLAHERGVVHGDVRPSRLVYDRSDRLVLNDFGVASILQRRVSVPDPYVRRARRSAGVVVADDRHAFTALVRSVLSTSATALHRRAVEPILQSAPSSDAPLAEMISDVLGTS